MAETKINEAVVNVLLVSVERVDTAAQASYDGKKSIGNGNCEQ